MYSILTEFISKNWSKKITLSFGLDFVFFDFVLVQIIPRNLTLRLILLELLDYVFRCHTSDLLTHYHALTVGIIPLFDTVISINDCVWKFEIIFILNEFVFHPQKSVKVLQKPIPIHHRSQLEHESFKILCLLNLLINYY